MKHNSFKLIQSINGGEIREGDNSLLVRKNADGSHEYLVANDAGIWQPLLVEIAGAVTPDPVEPVDPAPVDPAPVDPTPGPAADINGPAELATALAGGAGVFTLAGGDYGALPTLPAGTALIGADPAGKPTFSASFIKDRDGITLDGLHFKHTYVSGDGYSKNVLYLNGVTNFIMRNCEVEGDRDDNGSCIGRGVRTSGGDSLLFEDNEIHTVWKAIGISSSNATLRGNDIHTFRSDGINTGDVVNFLAEGNYIHDADLVKAQGDHRDSIQLMGTADGMVIRDNFIDIGLGLYSQSIWSDGKNRMDNVVVARNVIINSHTNGIALHNIGKIDVTGNVMVWLPRDDAASQGVQTPKVNVKSTQATVMGNTFPGIIDPSGVDALNTIQDGDPDATRAAARADPRWAHFFGG